MLKITYLSHSGFILDDGVNQVVIDPFLSGNPKAQIDYTQIHAKYVVATHAHGDHFGDTFEIIRQNNGTVITVNEFANYLNSIGCNAHAMGIGGAYTFPFGRVKLTIAHHGSSWNNGEYMGNPVGVVITMGGKTVYHAGDTGLFLDMKLIGERDKIDAFITPIGDNFTMGIDDAVKAAEFVNAEYVIPMHYNTYPLINQNSDDFAEKIRAIGKKPVILDVGETFILK